MHNLIPRLYFFTQSFRFDYPNLFLKIFVTPLAIFGTHRLDFPNFFLRFLYLVHDLEQSNNSLKKKIDHTRSLT